MFSTSNADKQAASVNLIENKLNGFPVEQIFFIHYIFLKHAYGCVEVINIYCTGNATIVL